jgi:hypothetical protein
MSVTERAVAMRPKREARPKPVYICRAKVGAAWLTIGAAWKFRSGEPGLSVQLNTLPINFDGRFVLLEPLEDGEEPQVEEPEPATPSEVPLRGRRKKSDDEIPF